MKENDWIVAGLTNPDINSGEFRALLNCLQKKNI